MTPRTYAELTELERITLQMWIAQAMEPAEEEYPCTSYGLKTNVDRELFFITNETMKGAMLAAGYAPANTQRPTRTEFWTFQIRPRCLPRHAAREANDALPNTHFGLCHLDPRSKELRWLAYFLALACMSRERINQEQKREKSVDATCKGDGPCQKPEEDDAATFKIRMTGTATVSKGRARSGMSARRKR